MMGSDSSLRLLTFSGAIRATALVVVLLLALPLAAQDLYSAEDLVVRLPGDIELQLSAIPPNPWEQESESIRNGFYMGKFEVTRAQWDSLFGDWENPSIDYADPDIHLPQTDISQPRAGIVTNKLTEYIRLFYPELRGEFRLPSIDEWQYAYSAGGTDRFYWGEDESLASDCAWYWSSSHLRLHPVGQKEPNLWGLYDMSGNASEWTSAKYLWCRPANPGYDNDNLFSYAGYSIGGNYYDYLAQCSVDSLELHHAAASASYPCRTRIPTGEYVIVFPKPYPQEEWVGCRVAFFPEEGVVNDCQPVWDFEDGDEGWEPYEWPPYSAPEFAWEDEGSGSLSMTSTGNEDLVGIWHSPPVKYALEGSARGEENADRAASSPTGVLALTGRISTDETDPRRVPQVRLRTTAIDAQQSDLLSLFSFYDGAYSPTPEGREYRLYFKPPPSNSPFNCEFDLLNFDVDDSPSATVMLDRAAVTWVPDVLFSSPRLERSYDFDTDAEGWTFETLADQYAEPIGEYSENVNALRIQIADTPDFQVGYWTSTTDPANNVLIEPGRIYYAVFRVASDIREADQVPTFRLRLNTSLFRACHITTVNSTGSAENSPTRADARSYTVFLSTGIGTGQYLISSFDLLAEPGRENLQAGGSIYLQQLQIYSVND
ncbi:formylglycine-generating enzyme family protein [bacterium]|nr:formylglycine-generating enzyme family protein [bacterium]